MSILGKRIKSLREENKIQQTEFAKIIGVSNVVLSRYETGDRKPDYDTLIKIAEHFDVTIDYLLGRSDDPSKTYDEELEEFINNVRVWYKDEPEDKEERLQMMKEMFEVFKKRK